MITAGGPQERDLHHTPQKYENMLIGQEPGELHPRLKSKEGHLMN